MAGVEPAIDLPFGIATHKMYITNKDKVDYYKACANACRNDRGLRVVY